MLSSPSPISAPACAPGRLLIHAGGPCPGGSDGRLAAVLRWLRTMYSGDHDTGHAPLRLQIADLQGNVMLTRDHAGTLVEVALPAGRYRVTAQSGHLQRDYTLVLEHGAVLNLYVHQGIQAS